MPPEDQTPSSQSSAAGSSAGSWAAGSPFVGNAGPAFDPDDAGAQQATPLHVVETSWEATRLRAILRAQGILTHDAVGVGQEDWLWRESELEALAEPLANSLNKVPIVRAAAAVSDELTASAILFNYARRSITERARVIRAQKQRRPPQPPASVPITGVDAEGRRVAPDQVEWEVND